MAFQRVQKAVLFSRVVAYGFRLALSVLSRALSAKFAALTTRTPKPPADPSEVKNVVVVGASFAGYLAARILAASLPRDGRHRVVVIEPSSHFNFTWVLPRFCVVQGHEHKAFIPYTPAFFSDGPKDVVQWVRDRVISVQKGRVILCGGDEIPYEFLIIATGSTVADGLPSRVGADNREEGIERLKAMQARIKAAARVVVAGGGAAGVELAADIKSKYPDKSVTLVHSRQAVMHRFGPELQKRAMDALRKLGVDVVLGERVDSGSAETKSVTLQSGQSIECDCFVCAPATDLVSLRLADRQMFGRSTAQDRNRHLV
jgi:NADH dehydrogenase FAD-containing subunit